MDTLINILGGIALLLWGIRMVRTGFTRSFGASLRRLLSVSARNRVRGFGAGVAVATAIQSSTATAVIIASFAAQGLVGNTGALAVVLGADLGTALVVQILSFDLAWLSPLLVVVGVFTFFSSENSKRRSIGRIFLGLGLVLLSLQLITTAATPLREAEAVAVLLQQLQAEPLLAVICVAALTWASHSSVAVVLFVMSLASMQVLGLQMAMIMVLGANLGSGITAAFITLRASAPARRVTFANLAMRAAGVLIVLPLIPYAAPYLLILGEGGARFAANFHLAFNLALAAVFLPLLGGVSRVVGRLVPDPASPQDESLPRYLDKTAMEVPTAALSCAAREALRMGDSVRAMLNEAIAVFRNNDDELRKWIEKSDDLIDRLHEAIKLYLTRLSKEELDSTESARSIEILSFTTNLEHVGDIIDKNLMELAAKKIKSQTHFSEEGQQEIEALHGRVLQNLDLAMSVFMSGDLKLARQLLREKSTIRSLELSYTQNHYERIGQRRAESIETSSLHLDILRDLKRINSHLASVAYPILERAGELADSRLLKENTRDEDLDSKVE